MLLDEIRNGESDQLEFKELPNRDSGKWLKTVVAPKCEDDVVIV